ncbi:T cell receptor alpha chain MC.7.G5-like [Hyperolius riggenbachi]|uniref:T cell receptor alpha chain MC.7.G5-like n=1 Tax=Hyperolius riggenbachi TaxID=752182 RepID=UPI0035A27087
MKVIFGSGTKLVIKPKTTQDITSVYKLESSKEVENIPNSVCLITDFPSPNKTLKVDGKDKDITGTAVLDKSEDGKWRYSTIVLGNKGQSDDLRCKVKYNDKDVEPETGTVETAETCDSTSSHQNFQTNPAINTLSQKALGLRILTAKFIVFNVIATLRLWSS